MHFGGDSVCMPLKYEHSTPNGCYFGCMAASVDMQLCCYVGNRRLSFLGAKEVDDAST